MPENVTDKLIISVFELEKLLQGNTLSHILGYPRANCGQVKLAIVNDRIKLGQEVVMPRHFINVIQFEEVGCH